jgi:DNA (cytosine-5)-methyltransferase 1
MRGDPAPRREAGEGAARPIAAGTRSNGYHNDADAAENLVAAYGGNNTSGPLDVATARNTHAGPHGRLDFESETFVAHSLRANSTCDRIGNTGTQVVADPVCANEARTYANAGNNCRPRNVVAQQWAVRRLTPVECERLQGFPDGYTAVPYRGKPAADGPRYKALGNSMAVNVMRWIGRRIEMVNR